MGGSWTKSWAQTFSNRRYYATLYNFTHRVYSFLITIADQRYWRWVNGGDIFWAWSGLCSRNRYDDFPTRSRISIICLEGNNGDRISTTAVLSIFILVSWTALVNWMRTGICLLLVLLQCWTIDFLNLIWSMLYNLEVHNYGYNSLRFHSRN